MKKIMYVLIFVMGILFPSISDMTIGIMLVAVSLTPPVWIYNTGLKLLVFLGKGVIMSSCFVVGFSSGFLKVSDDYLEAFTDKLASVFLAIISAYKSLDDMIIEYTRWTTPEPTTTVTMKGMAPMYGRRKKNPKHGYDQCMSLTKKSDLCNNNGCFDLVVENFRYQVCNTHKHVDKFTKGMNGVYVQPQLIEHLEPQASQPERFTGPEQIAARFGMRRARDVLAELETNAGPITQAYLNREAYNPSDKEDDTMFLPILFPGHRPDKLGGYRNNPLTTAVKKAMLITVEQIITANPDRKPFIVWGGALGTDQISAYLANHLGIPHVAMLPFKGFNSRWPEKSNNAFQDLARTADAELMTELVSRGLINPFQVRQGVAYISDPGYDNKKFQERNKAMVDIVTALNGVVIAVFDGSSGGTANAVGYAVNRKANLAIINPGWVHHVLS